MSYPSTPGHFTSADAAAAADEANAQAFAERRAAIEREGAGVTLVGPPAEKRMRKILFRVSEEDWQAIHELARTFAEGNVTRWCTYGALNAPRVRLVDLWRDAAPPPSAAAGAGE